MAEAFVNHLYSDRWRAESAGTIATEVNPYAIKVMEELGISMEGHRSKSINEFRGRIFDLVVTVCDQARETCPFFPGKQSIHRGFPDPSEIKGSEKEIIQGIREVRDQIKEWIMETFAKEEIVGETKLIEIRKT